jgi:hypothetical protein
MCRVEPLLDDSFDHGLALCYAQIRLIHEFCRPRAGELSYQSSVNTSKKATQKPNIADLKQTTGRSLQSESTSNLGSLIMASISIFRRAALGGVRSLSRVVEQRTVGRIRNFSFTFAGPRHLDDIVKKDLLEDKNSADIAEIWCSYHEEKVRLVQKNVSSETNYCGAASSHVLANVRAVVVAGTLAHTVNFAFAPNQEDVLGLVLDGKDGETVLSRAQKW